MPTEPAAVVEELPDPQSPDPLRRPITELDLSVRSRRIVDLLKIRTIGDLVSKTEAERTRLAQSVAQLNGSLTETKARGVQLDQTLKLTDELQTDVSFRTNEASISAQAMAPLLKLGALAAAMPDVKVRVAGYADPRGSDALNDALSQHRAQAVAAVLAGAGLAQDRLIVEAHGKCESTSTPGDLDGYAFDRRVTVRLERPGADEVARRD